MLEQKATDRVSIDVNGVGYLVQVPLSTYYELGDEGSQVGLRIHTHVRDNGIQLFGFLREIEQRLFERLIGVSGIGPKLAVTILSGMETEDLMQAIGDGDVGRLSTIPGVGRKTADRLTLELKDRILEMSSSLARRAPRTLRSDVVSALCNLGYKARDAERALNQVEDPGTNFEILLRQTLKSLAR